MTDKEFVLELWSIVKALTTINDYEFPYRIPELRSRADRLKSQMDEELAEYFPPEMAGA